MDIQGVINTVIGFVANIANMFGQKTGVRIGATTGTALIILIVTKLIEDKLPKWLQWLLYLGSAIMAAGSGANILQSLMKAVSK